MAWIPSSLRRDSSEGASSHSEELRALRSLLNKISPDNANKIHYESNKLFQTICETNGSLVPEVFRLFLQKSVTDPPYIAHYVQVLTKMLHQSTLSIKQHFLREFEQLFQSEYKRKDKKRLQNTMKLAVLCFVHKILCQRILVSNILCPLLRSDQDEHLYALYVLLDHLLDKDDAVNLEFWCHYTNALVDKSKACSISSSLKYQMLDLLEKKNRIL
jgi:hypothetical protein